MSRSQPTKDREIFRSGTLLERVRATSAAALYARALEPIHTDSSFLEDHGIRFLVRVVSSLRRKPPHDRNRNPFLPFEAALYVADASNTHVCILNKYNVVDLHLLIVTREFEHQESLVTVEDFRALWRCLGEYEALGFYNSGPLSGASQPHKHLQVVPLPLSTNGVTHAVPIEPLFDGASSRRGVVADSPDVPFAHSLVFWDPAQVHDRHDMAETAWACYIEMLRKHGLGPPVHPDKRMLGSYNLLITRRWMMLVPRVRECFQSISFNSLAFAGALLVQAPQHMDQLRMTGPLAALQWVAAARR